MNGYNFSERVRKVLQLAREAAVEMQHGHVSPGHVLLGLIDEGGGVAVAVLQNREIDLEALRRRVVSLLGAGTESPTGPDLPYTRGGKKVLEFAMAEARELGHNYVGTEHILLGLIREEQGIAAQALREQGLILSAARDETTRILGVWSSHAAEDSVPGTSRPNDGGVMPIAFTVLVEQRAGRFAGQRFTSANDAIDFLAQWIRGRS